MIRKFFQPERQFRDKYGFRWRGGDISRLESFSDAVFAFSITLLIVSLEVPKTFTELMTTMQGFVAFGASFAILIWIWHAHYIYFRRYGIEDAFTKTLNAFLLFLVLFYVYPLKFVFSSVIHLVSQQPNEVVLSNGVVVPILQQADIMPMMAIYGGGFIAVFASYSLMYWYAGRKKEELRLSELEVALTAMHLKEYLLCILIGVISVSAAVFVTGDQGLYSGFTYFLLGPVLGLNGWISKRKIAAIRQRMNLDQPQRDQRPQGQRQQNQGQRPQGQQQRQQNQNRPRPQGQQQRPHQRPPQERPPSQPRPPHQDQRPPDREEER